MCDKHEVLASELLHFRILFKAIFNGDSISCLECQIKGQQRWKTMGMRRGIMATGVQ